LLGRLFYGGILRPGWDQSLQDLSMMHRFWTDIDPHAKMGKLGELSEERCAVWPSPAAPVHPAAVADEPFVLKQRVGAPMP
jgi:hypothetical protein